MPTGNWGEQAARRLEEDGEVKVGGMIASIGQRLLAGATRRVAGQIHGGIAQSIGQVLFQERFGEC